jgi:hypothetical protein
MNFLYTLSAAYIVRSEIVSVLHTQRNVFHNIEVRTVSTTTFVN